MDRLPSIAGALSVEELASKLRDAYGLFTRGLFREALSAFRRLLRLVLCSGDEEEEEKAELKSICREYVLALEMELKRRDLASAKQEPTRQLELAAYVSHCGLQAPHKVLVLRAAMNAAFAHKNYLTAAGFARRLLDLNPKADIAATAQKVCQFAEGNPTDAMKLAYEERNPFVTDARGFVPIYRGEATVCCGFCGASAAPEAEGKVCPVCQMAAFKN